MTQFKLKIFMRAFTFLLVFIATVSMTYAQSYYSFISDKRFHGSDELVGYSFTPDKMVFPDKENPDDSEEVSLSPKDIIFRITRNYLVVESETYQEYKGAYSVNSIDPTEYGFKISLMNARNPSIQGHLKFILNKKKEVDAYIFKPANTVDEVIFYQAQIPKLLAELEQDYFTDVNDLMITDTTLWYSTIHPFFEVEQQQRRLLPSDSLSIYFNVDTVITNPKKNKIRIDYSIVLKGLVKSDDGDEEVQRVVFPVSKTTEREDKDGQNSDARYRIEFEVKSIKSGYIYLYLSQDKFVTSMVIDGTVYTMRGIK